MSPSRGGDAGDRGDSGGRGDSGDFACMGLGGNYKKLGVWGNSERLVKRESWREEQRSNMHSLLRGLDFIQAAGE